MCRARSEITSCPFCFDRFLVLARFLEKLWQFLIVWYLKSVFFHLKNLKKKGGCGYGFQNPGSPIKNLSGTGEVFEFRKNHFKDYLTF